MSTTTIVCQKCGRSTLVSCDALRDAIDMDLPPPCRWCSATMIKDGRRKRVRTAAELVLFTIYNLSNGGSTDVFRSNIVMESWITSKEVFGLRGINQDHPDAKRVDTELSHLIRDEYIQRTRPLYYTMTQHGVDKIHVMMEMNVQCEHGMG